MTGNPLFSYTIVYPFLNTTIDSWMIPDMTDLAVHFHF